MNKHSLSKFFRTFSINRGALRVAICSSLMFVASYVIATTGQSADNAIESKENTTQETKPAKPTPQPQTLIVAGGCFWCVESDFEKYPGVLEVVSGYTGGHTDNPTYKEVTYKNTGHFEAVKITFDANRTSVKELTEYFWATVDPTDSEGQFCDKGDSYKTALFYQDDAQKTTFEQSLEYLKEHKPFSSKIVTPILPAKKFYLAEDYHQDFYNKNPLRYYYYRTGCRRDARIKQLWGKVASKEING